MDCYREGYEQGVDDARSGRGRNPNRGMPTAKALMSQQCVDSFIEGYNEGYKEGMK